MQTQEPTQVKAEAVQPPEALQLSWRTLIEPWWKATLAILPAFLITRLIFLLLTYFGGVLFFVPNYWTGQLTLQSVLYSWYRWDSIRFITMPTQRYIILASAPY